MNYEFLIGFTPRILDVVERNAAYWREFRYDLIRDHTRLHTFSYVLGGEGVLELEGEKHTLRAGDLFQVRPGTFMRITTTPEQPVCFISFQFHYRITHWENGEMLQTVCGDRLPVSGNYAPIGQMAIEEGFRNGLQIWESKEDGYEWRVKLEFLNVIQKVNELTNMEHEETPTVIAVQKATAYIKKHFQQPISREIVAEHVSLSPGYLSIAFKKYIGLGIVAYIVKMRLDHAKYLLKSSKLPIRDVSDACGFTDSFYFTRVFKKETGMSPRDYRNS
ncbi:AraC family transcriptional regulator [Paenibacillus chondroitinus]|uniref:AraC family transcriptional regulator n=1 Tax=Paenibacillus chondroitinus TaxID=59842 RepID=A0ABU6DDK3_9BACL|nr:MULTISPECIES: AraC family transcriptional regulator [Paenibacillus]MCY9659912.1 AraC family transcriptional regulator [Paenibacillus anseongense]MEB4795470.1 AraC family transcriptional regulator [Paenibacillus chondroitinus]